MKKQIRIPIPHGSARVDEDCPKEVIEALHKLAELAYKMPSEQLHKHVVMAALPLDCYIRNKIGCHCTDKCGYTESFGGNEP